MRLPSVIPNHEYPLSETLRWLIACKTAFVNGFGGTAAESLEKYQRKTAELSRGLEFIFSLDDVQKMLLTRRYWLLMGMVVAESGPTVNDLISAESTERQRYFETLVQTYTQIQAKWAESRTRLLVADTNVYEHHEDYWDEIDWGKLAKATDIRLLVPNVVVRELDNHKRTDRRNKVSDTNTEDVRTRARIATRRLRERFADPDAVVSLAQPGATAELLLDPPGHVPLEDPDSEIIDRALAIRWFTQRPVSVVTGDGNMQFAASSAGLEVINVYETGH
jgi:hypothetical protein